jgi:hypothetical protein
MPKVKPSTIEEMTPAQLAHRFPNLNTENYKKTSEADPLYNCVSWVVEDKTKWKDFYYLPNWEVNPDLSSNDYIRFFSKRGYKVCENSKFEDGKQKIALYENKAGHFLHVARQISPEEWTSKLGGFEDISHTNLEALEGVGNIDRYGYAVMFMERDLPK